MKPKAFTLLETIIVLAIITIFFAISIPLFSRLTAGTKLSTVARDVASVLRTARGYAISNNTEYYVKFNNVVTPNRYHIYYKHEGSDIAVDKIYKLPTGIWFYRPDYALDGNDEAIEFTADTGDTACFKPTGELEETGLNTSVYVADDVTTSAKSKKITVEKTTGRVKID